MIAKREGCVNPEDYRLELRKSFEEKSFFLSMTKESKAFVDFGCCDGFMLRSIGERLPESVRIGYDISEKVLRLARASGGNERYESNWESVLKLFVPEEATLILSSVMHEALSYSNGAGKAEFWKRVFETGFEWIAIRDTMASEDFARRDSSGAAAVVRGRFPRERVVEWEGRWGSLSEELSLLHFLVVSGYADNWEVESQEDHFPISFEEILKRSKEAGYETVFVEHKVLPFLRERTMREFGVEPPSSTHGRILLRKA